MDKGNILDKSWIALELTKISYNNKENIEPEEVCDTFNKYMALLYDTRIEEIAKIAEYKRQLISTKQENFKLQNEFNDKLDEIMENTFKKAIDIVETSKQDMEDYVYNALKEVLTGKK